MTGYRGSTTGAKFLGGSWHRKEQAGEAILDHGLGDGCDTGLTTPGCASRPFKVKVQQLSRFLWAIYQSCEEYVDEELSEEVMRVGAVEAANLRGESRA